MDDDPRREPHEPAPEVSEERPGGDLAGSVEDEPADERPEHVRPTSAAQERTRFVGAPESGED